MKIGNKILIVVIAVIGIRCNGCIMNVHIGTVWCTGNGSAVYAILSGGSWANTHTVKFIIQGPLIISRITAYRSGIHGKG